MVKKYWNDGELRNRRGLCVRMQRNRKRNASSGRGLSEMLMQRSGLMHVRI
jgi:hypothetical protein